MLHLLRDVVLVRFLDPEERAGRIAIPETARDEDTRDGLVIQVGPKCSQVQVGDRCVSLRHHVRSWVEPLPPQVQVDQYTYTNYVLLSAWCTSRGIETPEDLWEHEAQEQAVLQAWLRGRFALIAERDLVAVIPGPEHAELKAANDYVLIEPDRHRQYEERPSGVVVAGHSLPGFLGRSLKRGKELLDQATALVRSPRFLEATPYDQWRMRKDWEEALSSTDRAAWLDACRDNGEAGERAWAWTPFVSKASPVTGRLSSVGPMAALPVRAGERCSWSKEHRGAELFSGGRAFIALRAGDLDSVVVEEEFPADRPPITLEESAARQRGFARSIPSGLLDEVID